MKPMSKRRRSLKKANTEKFCNAPPPNKFIKLKTSVSPREEVNSTPGTVIFDPILNTKNIINVKRILSLTSLFLNMATIFFIL